MKKILIFFIVSAASFFPQDTLLFNRPFLPSTDTTIVFTPSNKIAGKNALVILLHGWSGNYSQWSEIINLQKYSDEYGFTIACPDGFYDSWYADSPLKSNYQMEKFFIEELIPSLIKRYNIDTSNIFISGLSMGGHGAFNLFFRHPQVFRSAGSTSGILDITQFPSKWGMENIFGDYETAPSAWENASVHLLIKNLIDFNKEFIFDCGTEDFAYKVNKDFYDLCRQKNLKAKFISQPGNHSRSYWENSIKDHLLFFSELAKKPR